MRFALHLVFQQRSLLVQFVKVESKLKIDDRLSTIQNILLEWDYEYPCKLSIEKFTDPRSLSQNALMHMWFTNIADRLKAMGFKVADEPITANDVKLMMKHKFLGVKDIARGNLVIKDQLVQTSSLDKGEMTHFMDQVYHWAMEKRIYLPIPEHSAYKRNKDKQNGY